MKLMVIGGSGFFGKSILDAHARGLLAPWDIREILIVARNATHSLAAYPELLNGEIQTLDADIATVDALPAADYVVHAASSTDARRYVEQPEVERANILASIENYCRIARECHAESRIVYTSSGAVYGQQPADIAELREDYRPGDVSQMAAYKRDYAEAKRLAEERIADLGASELRVSVARCFAFVGFYLPRDQHFAIGNFLADGLAGRPINVKATKPVYRSYMHADDLVRWLLTIADAASTRCPVYNVGSDEALTMGEIAEAVARRFGVQAIVPLITSGQVDRYIPSIAKARRELGLTLDYDLARALGILEQRLHENSDVIRRMDWTGLNRHVTRE